MRRALLISLAVVSACQCEPPEPTRDVLPGTTWSPPLPPPDAGPPKLDAGLYSYDGGACPVCTPDGLAVFDCAGHLASCPERCAGGRCLTACERAELEQSTVGCEFYAAPVPPQFETFGSCYALFVANTTAASVELEVSLGARALDARAFAFRPRREADGTLRYEPLPEVGGKASVPTGAMAILFLADERAAGGVNHIDCPASEALSVAFQAEGTARFDAFHVKTSGPVAAWDIYPYGGAKSFVTSASLLLPTSAWSTSHVALTPAPGAYVQLIARHDDTVVQMSSPSVAIEGSPELPGVPQGRIASWTLARGEVAQLSQRPELGGAVVRSTKPVAVIGGHACMNKPEARPACDSAHQQLPGVPLLGHEYVGVRHPARSTSDTALWRLVGVVDDTRLSWTPPVAGAPSTLQAGEQVEFEAAGPFVVTAQDDAHVFAAAQLMSGGSAHGGLGDPDFVLLVPPGQYLARHLFFTDPTYADTHVVFTRRRGANNAYAPVTLDCGAALRWVSITPDTQYAVRSWKRDGTDGCENGVHTATSAVPFGITVWGVDQYASYAWPSGTGVRKLNDVDAGLDMR